jgi:hypothetical protein
MIEFTLLIYGKLGDLLTNQKTGFGIGISEKGEERFGAGEGHGVSCV